MATETTELIERLSERVLALDPSGVERITLEALAAGASPQEIISGGLGPGMEAVGKNYEEGEFFVPELLISARAMKGALDLLQPHLERSGGASPGTVVLGTVEGDVHEIGKNIVGAVLAADGFEVHDLGEDVPPREFVARATELEADVVGMSALISLAVSKMAGTVAMLRESGFGGRVIVGGAALTRESAEQIGADAFAADAWDALGNVRSLIRELRA